MKLFPLIFLLLIFGFYTGLAQDTSLIKYQSYFNGPLKDWCNSYNQFDLVKFKFTVSYNFETVNYMDVKDQGSFANEVDTFYKLYKPLLAYSPDRNSFIDIYSNWLNREKKDNKIVVSQEVGQAAVLCDYKNKTATRILFCGDQTTIDEAIWVSNTKFILCCFNRDSDDKRLPFLILGDTERKVFWFYDTPDTNCFRIEDYSKIKLKKAGIEME